jgi:hypothetical protein
MSKSNFGWGGILLTNNSVSHIVGNASCSSNSVVVSISDLRGGGVGYNTIGCVDYFSGGDLC